MTRKNNGSGGGSDKAGKIGKSDAGGDPKRRKVTTLRLQEMKDQHERIACLTAYDAVMARLLDEAGIDVLLVGDSAGMVFGGYDTTISVTMAQMLYHATVVARAAKRALVVGDLPFMSYQASVEEALRNAGAYMKEALVEAVKLEGGEMICPTVRRIVGLFPDARTGVRDPQLRRALDERAATIEQRATTALIHKSASNVNCCPAASAASSALCNRARPAW